MARSTGTSVTGTLRAVAMRTGSSNVGAAVDQGAVGPAERQHRHPKCLGRPAPQQDPVGLDAVGPGDGLAQGLLGIIGIARASPNAARMASST